MSISIFGLQSVFDSYEPFIIRRNITDMPSHTLDFSFQKTNEASQKRAAH